MADWSLPGLTDLYTNILTYFKGRDDDAVRVNDTRVTPAATNLPTYAKRWNNTAKKWESWNGSTWANETLSIQGGGTGATAEAGARTNLDVYQKASADTMVDGKITTHNAVTATPHGAVSTATASKIIVRDGAGKARVTTPVSGDDSNTIATIGYVGGRALSGIYPPTLFLDENINSATPWGQFTYMQIGDIVSVGGFINSNVAAIGRGIIGISLPIASNLYDSTLGGAGATGGQVSVAAMIYEDTANDRARMQFWVPVAGNHSWSVSFQYKVH